MRSSFPLVNIITVNYNSSEELVDSLDSLLNSTFQEFRLFIVDNLSTDNSISNLMDHFARQQLPLQILSREEFDSKDRADFQKFVLVTNQQNLGYADGNNIVIRKILEGPRDSFIWLLNPDVAFEPEVLSDLVSLAEKHSRVIVGNKINSFVDRNKTICLGGSKIKVLYHGVSFVTDPSDIQKLDSITGASLFTSSKTFREIGLLPEEYFLYWEETHFCKMAKDRGYAFEVNLNSIIYDRVGASSETGFTREYLYILNGLRFYRRFYKITFPLVLGSVLMKLAKALVMGDRLKINAIYYGITDYFLNNKVEHLKKRIAAWNTK